MATSIDPRVPDLAEQLLDLAELYGYVSSFKKLPKAERATTWGKIHSFHDNRELTWWVGPTIGMGADNLAQYLGHEVGHVWSSLLRQGQDGDPIDEMFCNVFGRVLARCLGYSPDRTMPPGRFKYAAQGMAKYFDDEEREALEDVLPHLVVRLPEPERGTLLALFFDGLSLRETADLFGVHHKTIERRRDAGIAAIRAMMGGGQYGETV